MGGSQSTRKIGIDNEEAVGVIRVSENVANRLKSINNESGSKPTATASFTNQQPEVNVHNQIINSTPPAGAVYIPQPFITSTMMRQEIEKELDKNDRYWEKRIKSLQDNQRRLTHVMEAEFDKAYKEIGNNFSVIAPKNGALSCEEYKSLIIDCLKKNPNQTLNCSKVVNQYTSCISDSRSKPNQDNRSP